MKPRRACGTRRNIDLRTEDFERVDHAYTDNHQLRAGVGRVHDWSLSRDIVRRSPIPVFLAGGLNASNVARAITEVAPFGIDLCSGVRTNGRLDPVKLASLVAAMR